MWLDELISLNIGMIVGPPYAIISVDPSQGQLTGNSKLIIKGVGFDEGLITVRFINQKQYAEAVGTYVTENEISCLSPNYKEFGPKE